MTERAKPLGGTVPDDAFDVAVEHLSREQRRSRRKRDVRKRTVSMKRLTKHELQLHALMYPERVERPAMRGACQWCAICQEYRDGEIWNHRDGGVSGLGGDDSALHEPEGQGLQAIWSAGHSGLPWVAGELSSLSGGHGTAPERATFGREDEQQRTLLAGQLRMGHTPAAEPEPPLVRLADGREPNPAHDGLGEGARHRRGDDPQATEARVGRLSCGHDASEAHFRSRPCVFVGCKFNLFLDATRTGSLTFNFPDLEPGEAVDSCCLDIADQEGATLERVGEALNVTRERIRQVEVKAFRLIQQLEMASYGEHADGDDRKPVRVHQQEPT